MPRRGSPGVVAVAALAATLAFGVLTTVPAGAVHDGSSCLLHAISDDTEYPAAPDAHTEAECDTQSQSTDAEGTPLFVHYHWTPAPEPTTTTTAAPPTTTTTAAPPSSSAVSLGDEESTIGLLAICGFVGGGFTGALVLWCLRHVRGF